MYNGRKLTVERCLKNLQNKGCHIHANNYIDITDARFLGNGSWGMISFLKNYKGYIFFRKSWVDVKTTDNLYYRKPIRKIIREV